MSNETLERFRASLALLDATLKKIKPITPPTVDKSEPDKSYEVHGNIVFPHAWYR